ncbi:DUF2141 domain-containing protein [Planctomycetes bacterium K23_9]|uniref:DUF2141 domain-containing protein n=1 Tax=Stieleria marina TaxID=1930275 RepID=A0A517P0Y7_9BACT|nr:hypothetical protein K239x_50370 [Planctomycetes bacterium K23_9]
MDSFFDDYERREPVSIWKANHGNWLLALVAAIGVVGSSIMVLRGNGFTSPTDERSLMLGEAELTIENDSSADEGPLVTLVVKGAVSDEGQVMLAIYDAQSQFNDPNRAIVKAPRPIESGEAKWVLAVKKLPTRFAVAAFHDENADGLLNRSVFGIPTEPYGFSNQAKSRFGPPSFEQAVLIRPEKDQTIEIYLGAKLP